MAAYQRFSALANDVFKKGSKPLMAVVAYTVTDDGRITEIRLLHETPNPTFNDIVLKTISSLNENSFLKFPTGTMRNRVENKATFVWPSPTANVCSLHGFGQ